MILLAGLAALASSACGGNGEGTSNSSLMVFAASSLTEVLPELGKAFAEETGNLDLSYSFGSSSDLAAQVLEGAPVDVFMSADESNMNRVVDGGEAHSDPMVFATNTFSIILGSGNPLGIRSLEDLADPDLLVVVCAESSPCGKGAAEIFRKAKVAITPRSYEENVKSVVAKVVSGEADAGIVFATDILSARDESDGVPIPDALNVATKYSAVVTRESDNQDLAAAFIDFVAGDRGQSILAEFGFLQP